MTTIGLYDIGTSTTLESNKSLSVNLLQVDQQNTQLTLIHEFAYIVAGAKFATTEIFVT